MNSFLRWGATLVAVGGTVLGSWIAPGLRALALTQAEIEEQLRGIPVFTITDQTGSPFVAVIPTRNEAGEATDETTIVTEVFISSEDAEESLTAFQQANPTLADGAQVTPVSLALIYKTALEAQEAGEQLQFYFVPMVEEVAYAVSLFPDGQDVSPGVPLFIVSSVDPSNVADNAGQDVTLLTIQNNGQDVIPLFFTQDQFETALSSIDDQNPTFRENLQVDVIWLGDYIRRLEVAEGPDVQQYRMIPLSESIDYVESFEPNVSAPTAPAPEVAPEVPAE